MDRNFFISLFKYTVRTINDGLEDRYPLCQKIYLPNGYLSLKTSLTVRTVYREAKTTKISVDKVPVTKCGNDSFL